MKNPSLKCFEIDQAATIGELSEQEWDLMVDSNPLASYGWLRSIEQAARSGPAQRYLLVRDSEGLAAAFRYGVELAPDSQTSLDRVLFGGAEKIASVILPRTIPAVVVNKRVFRPGLADHVRRTAGQMLVEAVERVAQEHHAMIGFRQVTQEESTLTELLGGRGYDSGVDLPFTCLDISAEWRSLADYRRNLKRFHPSMEKNIGGELNRAKKRGLVIERVDESKHFGLLYGLLNDHCLRLNREPLRYDASILDHLKRNLGERLVVRTASLQDQPVGVSVGIRFGPSIAFPLVGIDQERGRSASAYFNLFFNRNIEFCIEQSIRFMHCGTLVYWTKVQRGCRLIPSHLYVRHPNKIGRLIFRPLLGLRSARIRSKYGLTKLETAEQQ